MPRAVRALLWVMLALLAVSAILMVAGLPTLRAGVASGRWPRQILALPPALLGAFVVGYGAYRLVLVRAKRYPAGKALAHVGLMVLGVVLVARIALAPPGAPDPSGRLERGLRSGNPDVRALAAELARHRPAEEVRPLIPLLVGLLEDGDPEVRREAERSLATIAGEDLGEGKAAAQRWRERLGEQSGHR